MYKKSHNGKNNPMYGRHHSEKTKKNMKIIHKGKHYSPDIEFKKGYKMSKITKQNLSKSLVGRVSPMKGKKLSKKHKEKISDTLKWNHPVNEFKKGHKHSEKTKEKIGKANSISNLGKKHSKEWIRNSLRKNPKSSLEIKFEGIIKKLKLPYKFVGNGDLLIGRKCPDFVNCNGKKIAIEVYYKKHKERYADGYLKWMGARTKVFKEYGWRIKFLDETKVNEEYVRRLKL